jgi:tripartite-type tricarboxylate transporter receptor subunit TctC
MLNRVSALLFIALACVLLAPRAARAQAYPTRPVSIIVAQPPGGGTDIIARIIANQLQNQLQQPFVVENRPGAGTVVGTAAAANAAPDGYTLITGLNANMAAILRCSRISPMIRSAISHPSACLRSFHSPSS